jgi:hypothetical protein
MSSARTRATRARLALVACVLWLGGVEVLPALHQARHDQLAPHRHDAGSLVQISFEDTTHRHPDGSIHWVDPRVPRGSARGSFRKQAPSVRHADAPPAGDAQVHRDAPAQRDGSLRGIDVSGHAEGLAHHAAALAPAPPPVTTPLPIDRRPRLVAVARVDQLVASDPIAASARGPPRLA